MIVIRKDEELEQGHIVEYITEFNQDNSENTEHLRKKRKALEHISRKEDYCSKVFINLILVFSSLVVIVFGLMLLFNNDIISGYLALVELVLGCCIVASFLGYWLTLLLG